ncbi:MAG: ATP-binding protein, partial [Kiloniellales bacterium]
PFARNDDPLVRSRRGTGLGLPIVKRLVERHHGAINLRSQPGRGTKVTVVLPLSQPSNESAAAPIHYAAMPDCQPPPRLT